MRLISTCLSIVVLVSATTLVQAKCDRWGNCYSSSGGTTYGYNARTGSEWSSRSTGSGMSGYDSRGNAWSYERPSGTRCSQFNCFNR